MKPASALWRPGGLLAGILFLLAAGALALRIGQEPSAPLPTPIPPPLRQDSLKIEVATDGFYRLTFGSLRAAGFDPGAATYNSLALSQAGQPVPFLLADEALIFYGQAPTSRYTSVRPYVLSNRPATAGIPIPSQSVAPAAAPFLERVPRQLHLEENHLYKSSARTAEDGAEPWFWEVVQVQAAPNLAVDLPPLADGSGLLTVQMWGATTDYGLENDHDFTLVINGQAVGQVQGDGESYFTGQLTLPAGTLRPGANSITLDNSGQGATFLDIMYLDWFDLAYDAPPRAVDDRLELAPGVAGNLSLSGFSGRPWLFDIARPEAPVLLTGWDYAGGQARLALDPDRRLAAVGPAGFATPANLALMRASTWHAGGNQADLLIIAPDELVPPLAPLVAARQAQGLAVALVPLEELYDAFGSGEASPQSILAFVRYTQEAWQEPAPRYLFLVGDATYDYRDYLGLKPPNTVPPLIVPVEYSGETVSDARLADVDGDAVPDLAVGRWPVSTPAAVESLVKRTLAYEQGVASLRALFTADGTSEEFSNFTDNLIAQTGFPGDQAVRLYGAADSAVAEAWNKGAWLVSYTGHGSPDMWGKDEIFTLDTVSALDGRRNPPIVVQFTCLTGYFAHPEVVSLSEVMLNDPQGPVLLVGATSLTLSTSQEPFAINLLNALQDPANRRIGDAVRQAKLGLNVELDSLREISDTFALFGDPTTTIVRPAASSG